MRATVDLGDSQIRMLNQFAQTRGVSRNALMRQAIVDYLDRQMDSVADEALGLWSDMEVDGVDYQERSRSEW